MGNLHNTPSLAPDEEVDIQFAGLTIPSAAVTKVVTTLVSRPIVRKVYAVGRTFHVDQSSNAEAWAAQLVGKEVTACLHCLRRQGPFFHCVVVDGHLGGACASCHYDSNGKHCSYFSPLRATVDPADDNIAIVGGSGREKRSASSPISGQPVAPSLRRCVVGRLRKSLSSRTRTLASGPVSKSKSKSGSDSASESDSASAFTSVFEAGSETTLVSGSSSESASAPALTPSSRSHPVQGNNFSQVDFESQLELARLLTPSGRRLARRRHLVALAALDCVEGEEKK